MKLVKESLFEDEDFKATWIKYGTSHENVLRKINNKPIWDKFEFALKYDMPWLVEYCLKINDKYPWGFNNDYLDRAVKENKNDIVRILLKNKKANPSFPFNKPIIHAAFCGNIEAVELMLKDSRVDASAHDNRAIRYAIEHKDIPMIKILYRDEKVRKSLHHYPGLTLSLKNILKNNK